MRPRTITDPQTGQVRRSKVVLTTRCGKYGYSSRKMAAAKAKEATRMKGELIHPYHCKAGCHAWHIGHPPGTRERAA